MTKQEIKDLIAAKIAGQGNQVDSGGALAEILDGIIDAMPAQKYPVPLKTNSLDENFFENKTAEQTAEILGITIDELRAIFSCEIPILVMDDTFVYLRIHETAAGSEGFLLTSYLDEDARYMGALVRTDATDLFGFYEY